ncbi:MAG: dienelactone hydrolase family protein, partial [Polyangiaceae bacterium]
MRTEIQTRDGKCPSYVYEPETTQDARTPASGPKPAVLVFMDGLGIRPAMLEVGERIAKHGYFVLLPDLFYRAGPYEPMDPHSVFTDPEKRKVLMEKFFGNAKQEQIMSDVPFFLDFIASQAGANKGKIGSTGYCMGGNLALVAAGMYPDAFAATASFHGGRLATDAPDSPHLLAPKMKAKIFVAGAIEDQSFTDEMKATLEKALTDAKV